MPASLPPAVLPAAVIVLCLVPLFLTPALPSVDFYAHIVRYAALAHPDAPIVAENYEPHWQLLPNLGMDVLGTAIMMVLPTMLGAKLLAAIVILAPVAGAMRLSRAIFGRVDPLNAALTGLLSYNLILFWGFANFLLGLGIALWSIGWWIDRRDQPGRQLAGMAGIGVVILLIHGLVFGLWGLMLGGIELMLAIEARDIRPKALLRRMLRLASLAVIPAILFTQMSTAEAEGGTTAAFRNLAEYAERDALWLRLWEELLKRIDSVLRVAETTATPWASPWVDRAFGLVLWGLLGLGLLRGILGLAPRLWISAGIAFVLIGLMPPNLFGVGHLDERMPLIFLALIAAGVMIRPMVLDRPDTRWLRGGLIALFPLHLLLSCWGLSQTGREYRTFLEAVRGMDTGETAVAAFIDGTYQRDAGLFCKPLLFLLQIEKGTAVPTFANPTQQPFRLTGPLREAARASGRVPRDMPRDAQLIRLSTAGFDTIVACDSSPEPARIEGLHVAAKGADWTLYRRQ
ncbi:MAG: hypothetical protein ACK5IB_07265 [Qingshengfaniella sp.]